jgi:hypothetical protein
MTDYPSPPAHLARYVRVLGPELAMKLFLNFGGSEVFLSDSPKAGRGGSELANCLGLDAARLLGDEFGTDKIRIPLAKEWLAHVMHRQGLSANAIARRLLCTDVTVRRMLKASRNRDARSKDDAAQLRLPF